MQLDLSLLILPFQEDCLLFFALFYYSLLFLKFERGVATPVTPPPSLDPPMCECDLHRGGVLTVKHLHKKL